MTKKEIVVKTRANNIDQLVGKKLRTRRLLLGITQEQLGQAINVSIQQIQKYEKASNRVSSGKLFSMAKFLNIPIGYFFEESNSYPNTSYLVAEEADEYLNEYEEKTPIFLQSSNDPSATSPLPPFFKYTKQDLSYLKIPEREILFLIKEFNEIKEFKVRKQILALVKSIKSSY